MQFKFEELKLNSQESWFKRTFLTAHAKKTALYIAIGAVGGFLFFYFTEGRQLDTISRNDILNSMFFGAFMGFFLTNSPCARGKC